MSLGTFITAFLGVKAEQSGDAAVALLVRWDPEAASEAEIRQIEDALVTVTERTEAARATYLREKREADAVRRQFDENMALIEQFKADIAAAADDVGKQESLTVSLETLVDETSELKTELDRETEEAREAEEFLRELEALCKETAENLKVARANLGKARQRMERAEVREQRAKEKEAQSKVLAGIRKSSAGGIATEAMNRRAEEAEQRTTAARHRADLLATPAAGSTSDHEVERRRAALAERSNGSLDERIAVLKGGKS